MEKLNQRGFEESDFPVTVSFKDKNGDALTPTTVVWNLTTMDGDIVNGREHVSITPASTVYVPIYGEDLAVLPDEIDDRIIKRLLTVMATYTSDLGAGRPLNKSVILEFESSPGIKDNLYPSLVEAITISESVTVSIS